ncbi:glycosyltransferase 25 family member [Chelonus insularis]|uniref:glycosyltransferase 25 family member n=1 Tax=Chelonus insularis TaxID=460826 RepID=UPI00158B0B10|nr:glycosyltransferase 25 family member [Chelonus insularis]
MHQKLQIFSIFFIFLSCTINHSTSRDNLKEPTIFIAVLVRNKAHTLPYFLTFLERLEYPKHRISLWIQSDNNIDNSIEILKVWLKQHQSKYHSINTILDETSTGLESEEGVASWPIARFNHIIELRENILNYARKIWADYLLMLDADVFLTNSNVLRLLISKNSTVVAPLLKSDGLYSNFWAGMTSDYYYKRTDKYIPILHNEQPGCYNVPMIHSAVLIDLNKENSDYLTYNSDNLDNYDGPRDDIITFALSANRSNIPLHICNDQVYGFIMVPLDNDDTLEHDYQQLINLKVEMLSYNDFYEIPISNTLKTFVKLPKKDRIGMDKIYLINLRRRPERRQRMYRCFDELGLEVETIDAVDGKTLNESILKQWNINMMPEYTDPYHKRPMKMGEIGCFLSHYIVWNKAIENDYEKIMVLEDDVKFEPFFKNKVNFIMDELKALKIDWDLIYLGRKRMQENEEPFVNGSNYLVYAGYSYWTLGYILSGKGAQKLLDAKPLNSLVPVDEYLPILFDKHPKINWKNHFPKRDLIALSTVPLIIYPTHYTGENGYISDTENSNIITAEEVISNINQKIDL